MKTLCSILALLIFSVNTFCSSADSTANTKIYHVNYWVTGVIIVGGMASDYFAIGRIKNKPTITDEELKLLSSDQEKDLINPIDQWALRQNPSDRDTYKKVSDYGQVGIYLLPTLLLFNKNIRKDWADILLMYVEGHTITFTFYNYSFLGPTFQNRYRPVTYYSEFPDSYRENGNNRNSFYSGHVASCTYSAFFMAKVYCDYHPDLGAEKYLVYTAALVPSVFMSYSRIKALDHFPSDDAVGLLLGAAIGIIVPELHKYPCSKNLSVGMFSSPYGTGLSLRWNLSNQRLLASGK
jgi:hypothetical protein